MASTPPSRETLLDLFERVTPPDFHEPLKQHDSISLIRGMAEIFAKLAAKGARTQQGSFFRGHAKAFDVPASSGVRASGTISLRRTTDTTRELRAEPGELRFEARGGRFFTNAETVVWYPQSDVAEVVLASIESEVAAFAGNLDHLADDEGNMPLDRIALADQSQDRANEGGSVHVSGLGTSIQDSGVPSLFGPDDVGLYVRINQADNAANSGRLLKIVGFDFPAQEIPVGSGLYPRRVFVDTRESAQPREVLGVDDSSSNTVDMTAVGQGLAARVTADQTFNPNLETLDETVTGTTGTADGTTYAAGARVFDGATDRLDFDGVDISGDYTFSCWVYVDALSGTQRILSTRQDAVSGSSFVSVMSSGRLWVLRHATTTSVQVQTADNAVPVGQWVHIGVRGSNSLLAADLRLYVDGVEATYAVQTDGAGSLYASDFSLHLGGRFLNDTDNLGGQIREAQLWNRELSELELASHAFADGGWAWPAGTTDDSLYIASANPIAGAVIEVVDGAEGTYAPVWEYWNGSAWAALGNITDPSAELSIPGAHRITWDAPADMTAFASPRSGLTWHIVRYRLTAAPTFTSRPTFSRALPLEDLALVAETGGVTWSIEDFDDLGVVIDACTSLGGGRDDDLFLLGAGRNLYQQPSETDDQFRQRVSQLLDTVSPNAVLRSVNRALRPYGAQGRAIDVQNGLTGAFADNDFFDYYTATDTDVVHYTVEAVATSNVDITVTGLPTVDGYTPATFGLILLAGQTDPVENGVYYFRTGVLPFRPAGVVGPAWGFAGQALHTTTAVENGTLYAGTNWIVNAGNVIDTDGLTIQQLTADTFPTDLKLLALSEEEAYGYFLVEVPYLGFGEFGAAFDESSSILLEDPGVYVSGFMDHGFMDGYPVDSLALYSAIYSSVDAIRAGGVNFDLVRSEAINALASC